MICCWNCPQKPKLKNTGWSEPHPVKYCPVCHVLYWLETKGLTDDPAPKWMIGNAGAKDKKWFYERWDRYLHNRPGSSSPKPLPRKLRDE